MRPDHHPGSPGDPVERWAARSGRGVLFDFNGTLSDDEPILLAIFTELFANHLSWSMPAEHYEARLRGLSDREIVQAVIAERGGDPGLVDALLASRARRYAELVAQRSPITAGAADLVGRLAAQGVPMGIVTGAQRGDVETVLASSPVGALIDTIVAAEDVSRGKPDPEGFLRGARLIGADPVDVLVVEDSVPGLRAARAAGMTAVVVSPEPTDEQRELADRVVPRLTRDSLAPALP